MAVCTSAERPGKVRFCVKSNPRHVLTIGRQSVQSSDDTAHLEQFWNKRNSSEEAGNKSTADARAFDPAVATSNMLISFGPLLFPTYRALLLRKRVLLISQPPLQPVCNYGK